MALSLHRLFSRGEVFPSYFVNNVIQAAIATLAENFEITLLDATTIRVPAGSGNDVSVIAVEQRIRYRETNCDRAHPGGGAATYDIWVVAKANSIGSVPDPNTDNTDYNWDLRITAAGVPPPYVGGTVDHRRKVGELTWSGAAITAVQQTVGGPQTSAFAKGLLNDPDAATMRATLGLVLGTNVQAWDADLDAWAGKTAPAGTVVGTSDTQTLSGKTLSDPQMNGRRIAVTAKTGNYTVTSADEVVLCDATGGAFTITLPAASGHAGRAVRVKKTDASTNQVTLARTGTDTLEGTTSFGLRSRYAMVMLASDGTNWHVMAFHPGLPSASLPSVAFDGQTHVYAADVTNGVNWDLVYRSAETTYKWLYRGGPPLVSTADPSTDPTMRASPGTFDALTGDVSISCPLTGDYDVSYDQSVGPNATATASAVAIECLTYLYWNGVQDNGTGHDIYTKLQYDTVDADFIGMGIRASGQWRRTAAPVGTVTPRHQAVRTNSIGNVVIDESTLKLTPVRVV